MNTEDSENLSTKKRSGGNNYSQLNLISGKTWHNAHESAAAYISHHPLRLHSTFIHTLSSIDDLEINAKTIKIIACSSSCLSYWD